MSATPQGPGSVGAGPHPSREAVLSELEKVLQSPAFRNARRSQDFLRYVVVHALDGRTDMLKERSIGADVFARNADYDTGDDSIVRVKASELRKRLAQYYHESAESEIRIELPAGAYVPEFRVQSPAPAVSPAPAPRGRNGRLAALTLALLVIGLTGAAVWWKFASPAPSSPLDVFWRPVHRSSAPVLLCVAHPAVYSIAQRSRLLLSKTPPAPSIPSADVLRDPDHFIGIGDAFTLARLAGYLESRGKPVQIRAGNDIAFADLRNSPAVLIGAFTNQWTLQMTSNLRFVFDHVDGRPIIRDQMKPEDAWVYQGSNSDYVLLSRIFDSRSGNVVITAAGLGHVGTQLAGEFLTNPVYLEKAIRSAPPEWPSRNMQLVLSGEVIGKTAGPPEVVASWYW
jgi:hypothetical protein